MVAFAFVCIRERDEREEKSPTSRTRILRSQFCANNIVFLPRNKRADEKRTNKFVQNFSSGNTHQIHEVQLFRLAFLRETVQNQHKAGTFLLSQKTTFPIDWNSFFSPFRMLFTEFFCKSFRPEERWLKRYNDVITMKELRINKESSIMWVETERWVKKSRARPRDKVMLEINNAESSSPRAFFEFLARRLEIRCQNVENRRRMRVDIIYASAWIESEVKIKKRNVSLLQHSSRLGGRCVKWIGNGKLGELFEISTGFGSPIGKAAVSLSFLLHFLSLEQWMKEERRWNKFWFLESNSNKLKR